MWIRGITESRWPNLSATVPRELCRQSEAEWSVPVEGVRELKWTNRQGLVPGRVTAQTWRRLGRSYYRVAGPNDKDGVFCDGIFKVDGGYLVYRFRPGRPESVWYDNAKRVVARSALPSSRFQSDWTGAAAMVSFWTPSDRPLGNLVYYHGSGGSTSRLSMDRPGLDSPLEDRRWVLP